MGENQMVQLFTVVLNNSITATVVGLILLALRYILSKKLPATFCYLLWGVLWFRLMVPYSLPSPLSVLNFLWVSRDVQNSDFSVVMEFTQPPTGQVVVAENFWNMKNLSIMTTVWMTGLAILAVYGIVVWIRTSKQLAIAVIVKDNRALEICQKLTKTTKLKVDIFKSSLFETPVVMGILKPRIILPYTIDMENEEQLIHILSHELVHIKRKDHISKTISTICLIVHWFNPMVWLCYKLYTDDVETSCDEYTLFHIGEKYKKGYIYSLIDFAGPRRSPIEIPLAFSESKLEQRVKGIARYKIMGK